MAATLILRTVKGSPLTNIEVDNNFSNLNTFGDVVSANVGIITNLKTNTKANVVNAINEVNANVGYPNNLSTITKANVVSAVNELYSNIGLLVNLQTNTKANVVNAINEVNANVGYPNNLTTSTKANAINAINEVNTNVGVLSNLQTTTKANTVNAINEVRTSSFDATNLTTGTLNAARLPASGVSASTYGGASLIPTVAVDSTGRVTSAANVAISLPASGVSASTYGGTSAIPTFTVGTDGRITSAANVSSAGGYTFTKLTVSETITLKKVVETFVDLGASGTAKNIDLNAGTLFTANLDNNCTFTVINPENVNAFTMILRNSSAGLSVSWAGGSFLFPGGAAALSRTTTSGAIDIWTFFTPNSGLTWYVNIAMKDMKA